MGEGTPPVQIFEAVCGVPGGGRKHWSSSSSSSGEVVHEGFAPGDVPGPQRRRSSISATAAAATAFSINTAEERGSDTSRSGRSGGGSDRGVTVRTTRWQRRY